MLLNYLQISCICINKTQYSIITAVIYDHISTINDSYQTQEQELWEYCL